MTTHLRACFTWITLLASIATGSAPACAQTARAEADRAKREVEAPTPPRPPAVERDALQELYRDLYEVQLQLARRQGSPGTVDSLVAVRSQLLGDIEELARRVERARARREIPRPPSARGVDDPSVLMGELRNLSSEVDWEEVTRALEDQAVSIGDGLAILGAHLKNLQVDVDSGRVRVDTGSGSRFTFTIPTEVKAEFSEGIREMSRELGRVLDDSTRRAFGSEFRLLLDELPEDVFGRSGRRGPRVRERKVIAESVFQTWKDFEVGDDEMVRGDVILVGGDAYILGEVQGNVYVLFGDLYVEGRGLVTADAVSLGGRVRVDDESEVHGRRFDVGSVLPGFGIGAWGGSSASSWLSYSIRVAIFALLLVFGYALAGRRLGVIVQHGEGHVARSLVTGALWFSVLLGVFVVAAVGLVMSMIGIPVAIVVAAAFVGTVLLAYFAGCQVVGERVLELFGGRTPDRAWRAWKVALIGLALLEIPALIGTAFSTASIPGELMTLLNVLDFFVRFLVLGIGFGAAVATRLGGPQQHVTTGGPEPAPLVSDV